MPRRETPDLFVERPTTQHDDLAVVMGTGAVVLPSLAWDYSGLDTEARMIAQQRTGEIKALMRQTAQHVIDIGGKLIDVKACLDHGQWGDWLQAEFSWSDRTARNFMSVAERFKSETVSDLGIATGALYLLASPSTPETARDEAIQRAQAGEKITKTTARQIIAEHKPTPSPPPAAPRHASQSEIRRLIASIDTVDIESIDPDWYAQHLVDKGKRQGMAPFDEEDAREVINSVKEELRKERHWQEVRSKVVEPVFVDTTTGKVGVLRDPSGPRHLIVRDQVHERNIWIELTAEQAARLAQELTR